MSAVEFRSWVAFYSEEPFGDVRADLRAGIVAATVARTVAKRGTRIVPLDFMPIVKAQTDRVDLERRGEANRLAATFEASLGPLRLRRVKLPKKAKP